MGKNIHAEKFDAGTLIKLSILREYMRGWLPVFHSGKNYKWPKIFIYDFFCGPGGDVDGNEGSPLIIMNELFACCEKFRNTGSHIDILFNDQERKKINLLKERIDNLKQKKCSSCDSSCPYSYKINNDDFSILFAEAYKEMLTYSNSPHFIFLDQNGIKYITEEVFRKIVSIKRCDFIFFISSSYLKRFADLPEFQRYLDVSGEVFEGKSFSHCHRVVFEFYKSMLPSEHEYYLAPFSIKKGPNIYGLIYGSNHTLGIEKFLRVCWNINPQTGDANFDIDEENINPDAPSLFPEMNRSSKLKIFEDQLICHIKNRILKTNKDVYLYTLKSGFLPKHANEVLRRLIKEKALEKGFQMSSAKIHNISETVFKLLTK
jgi:three-Cys-motif partner protein